MAICHLDVIAALFFFFSFCSHTFFSPTSHKTFTTAFFFFFPSTFVVHCLFPFVSGQQPPDISFHHFIGFIPSKSYFSPCPCQEHVKHKESLQLKNWVCLCMAEYVTLLMLRKERTRKERSMSTQVIFFVYAFAQAIFAYRKINGAWVIKSSVFLRRCQRGEQEAAKSILRYCLI